MLLQTLIEHNPQDFHNNSAEIAVVIMAETSLSRSDRSIKDAQMTRLWALEIGNNKHVAGFGRLPNGTAPVLSTRAEIDGRASILHKVLKVANHHNLKGGMMKIYIDKKNQQSVRSQQRRKWEANINTSRTIKSLDT